MPVMHSYDTACQEFIKWYIYNYLIEHNVININDVIVMAVTTSSPRTRMKDDIAI